MLHQYTNTDRQTALIKLSLCVVEAVAGIGIIISGTEAELGARRDCWEHVGEVLGAQGRVRERVDIVFADDLFCGCSNLVNNFVIAYQRRHADLPGYLAVSPHGLAAAFYDPVDGFLHGFTAAGLQAS